MTSSTYKLLIFLTCYVFMQIQSPAYFVHRKLHSSLLTSLEFCLVPSIIKDVGRNYNSAAQKVIGASAITGDSHLARAGQCAPSEWVDLLKLRRMCILTCAEQVGLLPLRPEEGELGHILEQSDPWISGIGGFPSHHVNRNAS